MEWFVPLRCEFPRLVLLKLPLILEIVSMAEQSPDSLKQKKLHNWIKQVSELISLLKKFGDKDAVNLLRDQRRKIEDILADLGSEGASRNKSSRC